MQFISSFLMYADKDYESGLNQESMSDDLMETDIEDLLDKKSGDLSENAREPEQTSEVLDETVNVLVSQENTVSLTPGMVEDVDEEVDDANKGKLFSCC